MLAHAAVFSHLILLKIPYLLVSLRCFVTKQIRNVQPEFST